MEKTEFLDQLRMSLNGKLSPQDVTENVTYYEDYINKQIRMGRPEMDVMNELGSPRLIARTITDASGLVAEDYEEVTPVDDYEKKRKRLDFLVKILAKFFAMPKWLRIVLTVIVVGLLLFLIFTVLQALLPVIIVVAIVLILIKFFKGLK